VDRWIAAKKFHSNLAPRLDREITRVLSRKPQDPQPRVQETGRFGEKGWSIRKHHPAFDDD